jgi:hypothetical protein
MMRRPRYRLTSDDLGRDYLVIAAGIIATVLGGETHGEGRWEVAYSDGRRVLLWPAAIAARINDGRWEVADRSRTCVGCGGTKGSDVQACDACRRRH